MAVYKIRSIGGKEHSRTHKIFGSTPAGGGSLGDDEAVERVTAAVGLTLAQRCGLLCGDIAWADAVALDVVLAILRADVTAA